MTASLPVTVQQRLTRLYALDALPPVDDFVATGEGVERERVVVCEEDDGVSLAVELPEEALEPPMRLDRFCQLVEGVSHFVLLAERARRNRTTTQLELELQGEIDKFLLSLAAREPSAPLRQRIAALRQRLFERVEFVDPPDTESGARYRLAHRLAARVAGRLEREFLEKGRFSELWAELRRFYRLDQKDKLAFAAAA